MSGKLNNQYTPAPLDIRALRRGGEDIVALCDEVEKLRELIAKLEPTSWPVGSLQWAMEWAMASGKRFRRRGEGDAFWCALHNDAVAWADSRNDQRDLTTADLVALDWEIYEEDSRGPF